MRRGLFSLGVMLALVVGVGGGAWVGFQWLGPQVTTVGGETGPILVTAVVEQGSVTADLIVRGTPRYLDPVTVGLAASDANENLPSVATNVPMVGDLVTEGSVVLEVWEGPVFALVGELPAIRDLQPGDEGPDVKQLQQALARLGYEPGPEDGVFGVQTGDAVARLYEASGFVSLGPSSDQLASLAEAEARSRDAELALTAADDEQRLRRIDQARQIDNAQGAVARAQAFLEESRLQLKAAELDALILLSRANDHIELLGACIVNASSDACQSLPEEPSIVEQLEVAMDDLARAELTAAEIVLIAGNSVDASQAEVTAAQADVDALVALQASASELGGVADAQRLLAEANENLDRAQKAAGVRFPASDVIYFSQLPMRIGSVRIEVGDFVGPDMFDVVSPELVIEASVTPADAQLVTAGMPVQIESESAEGFTTFDGFVDRFGDSPRADSRLPLIISVDDIDVGLVDKSLRITIPLARSDPAALHVPTGALSLGAQGEARIRVLRQTGDVDSVPVTVGVIGGGLVEVQALDSGSIGVGDVVVLGGTDG